MGRFVLGVLSALLLVGAGFFIWRGQAEEQSPVPPAPDTPRLATPLMQDQGPPPPPAAPEKSREEKRYARYDKNNDGVITRAEMMDTRRKAFAKLDVNGDGRLGFEEWAVATSERFAKADADRSGGLSAAEFRTTRRETRPRANCAC